MKSICVYCGSNLGATDVYQNAAQQLGEALADQNITLVYGGASVGIMGVVADTMLARGAKAVGVIPQALLDKEVGHTGLSELHVVKSMHERKKLMEQLSDGFVAMPGGMGTLEEIFEVLTWAQLGFHNKPCALLNVAGYYDHLLKHLQGSVSEGFIRPEHTKMLLTEEDPQSLIAQMLAYQPPTVSKWIDSNET